MPDMDTEIVAGALLAAANMAGFIVLLWLLVIA